MAKPSKEAITDITVQLRAVLQKHGFLGEFILVYPQKEVKGRDYPTDLISTITLESTGKILRSMAQSCAEGEGYYTGIPVQREGTRH
jgi:hypothetical protein